MKKKKIAITIAAMLIGVLVLSKINHQIHTANEQKELATYGVGEQVAVNGNKVNICTMGTKNADSTIVYLHGLGMSDTTITARTMMEQLQDDYKICLIDRPGNGMSDDTAQEQTIDNIVNTYREVLHQSGEKAPYILVAHSIAGMYATYWAQKFPQEIASIIYLDADPAECYVAQGKADFATLAIGKAQCAVCTLGLQRFLVSDRTLLGDTAHQIFSEKENEMRRYLIYRNTFSCASYSELALYYENAGKVVEGGVELAIPQLYIVANNVEGDYYNNVYAKVLEERYNGKQDEIQNKVDTRKRIIREKEDMMRARRNMEIVEISGPHCLYEYVPEMVSEHILQFLNTQEMTGGNNSLYGKKENNTCGR